MSEKRRDKRNRILHDGEFQRQMEDIDLDTQMRMVTNTIFIVGD